MFNNRFVSNDISPWIRGCKGSRAAKADQMDFSRDLREEVEMVEMSVEDAANPVDESGRGRLGWMIGVVFESHGSQEG
jgi:hypothetical protein